MSKKLAECLEATLRKKGNSVLAQQWCNESACFINLYADDRLKELEKINSALDKLALCAGSRVGVIMHNDIVLLPISIALQKRDLTTVLLNPTLSVNLLANQIEHAQLALLISTEVIWQALQPLFVEKPLPVLLKETDFVNSNKHLCVAQKQLTADIAYIFYSSGTTGQPKGVMWGHETVFKVYENSLTDYPKWLKRELFTLPLYHVFGITTFMSGVSNNVKFFLIPDIKTAPLTALLKIVKPNKISVTPTILLAIEQNIAAKLQKLPKWLQRLVNLVRHFLFKLRQKTAINLSYYVFYPIQRQFGGHLRLFRSSAAYLHPRLQDSLESLGFTILQSYGLSEGGYTYEDEKNRRPHTVGKAPKEVQIKIVGADENGQGELYFQSPYMMLGYFNEPELTAKVLVDGWCKTGDYARISNDGYVTISGRRNDIIVPASGENIFPDEIESLIQKVPHILDLCVFAWSDTHSENDIVALAIVPQLSQFKHASKEVIKQHFEQAVLQATHALPATHKVQIIFIVKHIPRTATFKVQRSKLVEVLRNQENSDTTTPRKANPLEAKIIALIKEELAWPDLRVEDNLFELGLSSITASQLLIRLEEEFHRNLDLAHIFASPRVETIALQLEGKYSLYEPSLSVDNSDIADKIPQLSHFNYSHTDKTEHILLTGASGFLGIHLLASLSKKTTVRKISCLVRAKNLASCQQRLQNLAQKAGLIIDWQKIECLPGDFSQEHFAVSDSVYTRLSKEVDTVLHCGAEVNHFKSLQELSAHNVYSLTSVLQLIRENQNKKLIFISSVAAYPLPLQNSSTAFSFAEHDLHNLTGTFMNGYGQSKWLCEALINAEREKGLKAMIIRSGWITGSSISGYWQVQDWPSSLICGFAQMQSIPIDSAMAFDYLPVDFVAHITTELLVQGEYKDYNFVNNHKITVDTISNVFSRNQWPLKNLNYAAWLAALKENIQKNKNFSLSPYYSLIPKEVIHTEIHYNNDNFLSFCHSIQQPVANNAEELLHIYLHYFAKEKCFTLPASS